ncbi:RING-type E3 ubiquitin transferase [Trifolium repens]|nr:RING-type E3 ubiquitin transferase [Trifolium repens]
MVMEETTSTIIMEALSTLTPSHLTHLTNSIHSSTRRHHRRLTFLLSSPSLFSLSLHYLHKLSLSQKTLLISRHLLSCLHLLTQSTSPLPPPVSITMREREIDAVLLLLLFCETHKHDPEALNAPFCHWRLNLRKIFSNTLLMMSCSSAPPLGGCLGSVLIPFIETVSRCWRLVGVLGCEEGKEVKEVAASAATVISLPAVEVSVGGRECVICKDEMRVGRDVCELPCQHLFHWMCILPWLGKRNTCPCCRFRLPSDDVLSLERSNGFGKS